MPESKQKGGTAVATRPPSADGPEEVAAALVLSAKDPAERQRMFLLSDALQQGRMQRKITAVIAASEWGAALSAQRQAAFATYCLALGADPLRHVDLLGGNPFPNGDYYRDVITANAEFRYADDPAWFHDDPRLQLCALCGARFGDKPDHGHNLEQVTEENSGRIVERVNRSARRIAENADEQSPAVCGLMLHYRNCPCAQCKERGSDGTGRGPFWGLGEVHSGKTSQGKDRDPIGLQSPRATAETRAWREAGEKAEPVWFRTHSSTLKQAELRLRETYEAEQIGPKTAADAEAPAIPPEPSAAPGNGEPASPPAVSAKMEQHSPTKICEREGLHPTTECGYHKPKGAA